jgi:glycosyltransferase involved in cell wall biosynthesis
MKVCRICQEFYSPKHMKIGLAPHFYNLSIELNRLGVDHRIITGQAVEERVDGIKIYKMRSKPPLSYLRSGLIAYKKIKTIGENFDIIHYHNPGYSLITLKKRRLPPIVMTLHDSPQGILESIDWSNFRSIKEALYFYYCSKFASTRVSALVCVSPGVKEDLVNRFNLNPDKVQVITTGVDLKLFYPEEKDKDIDILFVGRLVSKKRPTDLIRSISMLRNEFPYIKAYFVGGTTRDPMYRRVVNMIDDLDLNENIKLIEPVNQQKLRGYYQRSKMLVLPSTTESSPKVTLEAMACEVPVISTDIIGNKKILLDGKTGFLVPVKSPWELTGKISLLLKDEDLRKKMGGFGKRRVEKNFTWKIIANKYLNLYETLK